MSKTSSTHITVERASLQTRNARIRRLEDLCRRALAALERESRLLDRALAELAAERELPARSFVREWRAERRREEEPRPKARGEATR